MNILRLKSKWRYRLIFALASGTLYAGFLYLFDLFSGEERYSLKSLIYQGLFFGAFFGIGFLYLMEKAAAKYASKIGDSIKPDLLSSEKIEYQGPANFLKGAEGVGGKLFLTRQRLIFKSHKLNIQTGQTNILLEEIAGFNKRKTAKLFDNGIRIKTTSGKELDFVVSDRETWMNKLSERNSEAYK